MKFVEYLNEYSRTFIKPKTIFNYHCPERRLRLSSIVTRWKSGDFIIRFKFSIFSNYIQNTKCKYNNRILNVEDFIYEFVGNEIWRFNTLYHFREGLDRLGRDMNKSLNINKNDFIKNFLEIINSYEPSEKNLLISLYASYHVCLGRDIYKTKIILHHSHTREEDVLFKKVFQIQRQYAV